MKKANYIKLGFAILMAVYGILCAKDQPEACMLDRVNLIAHEAGHLLFSYLGEFLMVIGGTIGQLFVPLAFMVYFFLRKEMFSSAVALFWAGENFFSISVYIRDAQAMDLPLVSVGGGEDTIHDWNYILSKLEVLQWDRALGGLAFWTGIAIIALSIAWAAYSSFESKEEVELPPAIYKER